MTVTSPGGSTFPYYYKGGEIHCLKYGGFHKDKDGLFELMGQEGAFIQSRPAQRLRIWVDFYETVLTGDVLACFADHISGLQSQILKLAIVGCPLTARMRLKRAFQPAGKPNPFPYQFFADPEEAKTWLVS